MYRFVPLSTQTLATGANDQKLRLIGLLTVYHDDKTPKTIFRQIGAFTDHGKIGAYHPVNSSLEIYSGIQVVDSGKTPPVNTIVLFNSLMPENFQSDMFDLIVNLDQKELEKSNEKYLLISNTPTGINQTELFVGHLEFGCGMNQPLFIQDGFLCLKMSSWPKLLTYPFWINQSYRIVLGESSRPAKVVFTIMYIVMPPHFEYQFVNRCDPKTVCPPGSQKPMTPVGSPQFQRPFIEDEESLGMIGRPFVPIPSNTLDQTGHPSDFPPLNTKFQLPTDGLPDFILKIIRESLEIFQNTNIQSNPTSQQPKVSSKPKTAKRPMSIMVTKPSGKSTIRSIKTQIIGQPIKTQTVINKKFVSEASTSTRSTKNAKKN